MAANSFIAEGYKRNSFGIGFRAQRHWDFIRGEFAAVRVPMGLSSWRDERDVYHLLSSVASWVGSEDAE
jgi:hypothetical protein